MKRYHTIEELGTIILSTFEAASRLCVLLLTFGLIARLVNVLTEGSVPSDNIRCKGLLDRESYVLYNSFRLSRTSD